MSQLPVIFIILAAAALLMVPNDFSFHISEFPGKFSLFVCRPERYVVLPSWESSVYIRYTACFYWSAGKFGATSPLLCSCKFDG